MNLQPTVNRVGSRWTAFKRKLLVSAGYAVAILLPALVQAGSATWRVNPSSGDWNTAANWTPMTVPNGPIDTATFGFSTTTSNLTVGSNNLSTTLSGAIQDGGLSGGTGGSLTKIGTGTLTLSGASSYTGSTTIDAGKLAVNGSPTTSNVIATPDTSSTLALLLLGLTALFGLRMTLRGVSDVGGRTSDRH